MTNLGFIIVLSIFKWIILTYIWESIQTALYMETFFYFYLSSVSMVIQFFHPRHNGQWPPTSKDFLSQILSITFIWTLSGTPHTGCQHSPNRLSRRRWSINKICVFITFNYTRSLLLLVRLNDQSSSSDEVGGLLQVLQAPI